MEHRQARRRAKLDCESRLLMGRVRVTEEV